MLLSQLNGGETFTFVGGPMDGKTATLMEVKKYVGSRTYVCVLKDSGETLEVQKDCEITLDAAATPTQSDDGVPEEFAAWCTFMDGVDVMDKYRDAMREAVSKMIREAEKTMPGIRVDIHVEYHSISTPAGRVDVMSDVMVRLERRTAGE